MPAHVSSSPDLAVLTRRLTALLCDSLAAPSRAPHEAVADVLGTVAPDGSWEDIDYLDQQLMGEWAASRHLARLFTLAQAYRQPEGAFAGNPQVRQACVAALDYWLAQDFQNPNWWWNEIGVPTSLGNVLVLLADDLSEAQRVKGGEIFRRSRWARWTGQNLMWGVNIQLVRGCLEDDPAAVAEACARLAEEIRIVGPEGEGIQADMSFRQHGACLYNGGYGLSFANDCARCLFLVHQTAFAFAPETVELLIAYVLDGQQWMVRGTTFDYGAVGREISRKDKSNGQLLTACQHLAALPSPRRQELLDLAARLSGASDAPVFTGNRHFPLADLMTHHRPAFYASVRMRSDRIDNTDWACGGEGRTNHHLADGATFFLRDGEEYTNIFPAWDWRKVPGITVAYAEGPLDPESVRSRGTRSFVGGVSDGMIGLAAMEFERDGLVARKAWCFLDREIICLGAGITGPSAAPVLTAVNQCLLRGDVFSSVDGLAHPLAPGERSLAARWVHHDGIAYLFPAEAHLVCRNDVQRGRWSDIGTGSADEVAMPVLSLWLEHGAQPVNASYAYRVVPGLAPGEIEGFLAAGETRVLVNTPDLQAVWHAPTGLLLAAFYAPGSLTTPAGDTVSLDRPGLVLRDGAGRMTVVEPGREGDDPISS
jgi:chondroitin AC lyase